MKFIVIYKDVNSKEIYKEQFDTHRAALKFIDEILAGYSEENLIALIHGAVLEY